MSKFSLEILNKHVFPYFKTDDPDVILPPEFGEDIALTRIDKGLLVSHIDPIVGAIKDIGWLAVHVACNDIATSGAKPRWLLLLVLVPSMHDTESLESIMRDAGRAAEEIGASVIGGHTGYSSNLSRPLVAVTALGALTDEEPVCTKGARIGDHIFITKGIGLEGTAILANDFTEQAIRFGITTEELKQAEALMDGVSIIPEALFFAKNGATAMHDVTRGGLLETLLEMAKLANVCLEVNADQIPLPEIIKRFSSVFCFDPMKMISSGTLAAAIDPDYLHEIARGLTKMNIPFADIGTVIPGEGVRIVSENSVQTYTTIHAEEDELARMWALYK